ncbi:MAG: hypothetical protein EBS86_16010, partial [Crocinitomicaceae bacterium]|nr:hypothetical protein [Crocinitomicaceae bacterium]
MQALAQCLADQSELRGLEIASSEHNEHNEHKDLAIIALNKLEIKATEIETWMENGIKDVDYVAPFEFQALKFLNEHPDYDFDTLSHYTVYDAIHAADEKLLIFLLQNKLNLGIDHVIMADALYHAIKRDMLNAVKAFLACSSFDPTFDNFSALLEAIHKKNIEISVL